MIAIAGAKGGCGKTTVALGLTEAFARDGTAAIAIDADRQLPNLHVMAGTDRTPTLGSLDEDNAINSVAQESPRVSNAGIVSAPKPSETVDFRTAFDWVETNATETDLEVLIDCPSGAGPDVVEALSAASAVVIVTTDAERSIAAAETTLDIAQRLETPVLGVVCNRCESPPADLEGRLGIDILGAVPDDPDPITGDGPQAGFDEIATALCGLEYGTSPPRTGHDRLATGIGVLDRTLGGGIPAGSVVALTADVASQTEHLLYAMTATRGSLYLSTERSASNVERAIDRSTVQAGKPTIRRLDGEDPLEHALEMIEKLPDGANLIVDPIDRLETVDRERYLDFLNTVSDRMVETDGMTVFHCPVAASESANRRSTKHVADAVFDVHTTTPGPDVGVNQYLSVSKCRFDSSLVDTVELDGELATETTHEDRPVILE
ncbi:P-loop NTPase [Halobacteria archaeon AArc-curdl1]|uniref:P-loop NTPase n=1 Tax=Natronosalvus hydrolyticus TaxID=2979988 RepID=A0AAP2Z6T9_9EURY|nr:P-loop NTPase [Halobacteria archaeon AArc-curdl1]